MRYLAFGASEGGQYIHYYLYLGHVRDMSGKDSFLRSSSEVCRVRKILSRM